MLATPPLTQHRAPGRAAPPQRLSRVAAAASTSPALGNGTGASSQDAALRIDPDLGDAGVTSGGLRRTPLSGGVQSATARHDLPSPAVAVRNLMEQARFAHLCTVMSKAHHRRAGFPFGSLVDFAVDEHGCPVLALSPLAIHCRNALADPRCTLVVQMPGWSGLANARVTVFGELIQCAGLDAVRAAALLRAKHSSASSSGERSVSGQFVHFRMAAPLTDCYFVGGFGTVQWVDVHEYAAARADPIVVRNGKEGPEATLAALNAAYRGRLPALLPACGDAVLVSIDRGGLDARVRKADGSVGVERLRFAHPVDTAAQAAAGLEAMLAAAGAEGGH